MSDFQKVTFLSQRKNGENVSFRYIGPKNFAAITGEVFESYFGLVKKALDAVFCSHEINENLVSLLVKFTCCSWTFSKSC